MSHRVCPWYLGYILASPLRRLMVKPEELLAPFLKAGMRVLEVGPGMGFFSLPMARLVGPDGRIICVDLQENMVRGLRRRASRAGLLDRIETRQCSANSLAVDDLRGTIDFALAFAVVHEVPDQRKFLGEIRASLRNGATLLISEPEGHVTPNDFDVTVSTAKELGLNAVEYPAINRNLTVVMRG